MKKFILFIIKTHRYLSYFMFAQLFLWITGGLFFALIPFQEIIKGANVLNKPIVSLPTNWQNSLSAFSQHPINSLTTFIGAGGVGFKVVQESNSIIINAATGREFSSITKEQIKDFAQTMYKGNGSIIQVRKLDKTEYRLGIVDEVYGKTDIWQVSFDDKYASRFYFDGKTGEYITVRNNYWVIYDLFWRLHIMDYNTGEDFNGIWLRIFSILAFFFTISGIILTFIAIKRDLVKAK